MPPRKRKQQAAGPRPRRSLRTSARLAAATAASEEKEEPELQPEVAVPPSESGFETVDTEDGEESTRTRADSALEIAVLASPVGAGVASSDKSCDAVESVIGDGIQQGRTCGEGDGAIPIERLRGDEVPDEKVERGGAEEETLGTAIDDSADGGGKTSTRDDVVDERVEGESGGVKKKKVVKIVKKLVKKRVSKGFRKGLVACSNKELERDEAVGDGDSNTNSNAASLMVVEKPNLDVNGAKSPNLHTDGSVVVKKLNLAENAAHDSMGVEQFNSLVDTGENRNSAPDGSMEVEDFRKTETCGREEGVSVVEVPLQPENDEDAVVKSTTVTEVPEEHTNVDLLTGNYECGAMLGAGAEEGVKGVGEKADDDNLTVEGKPVTGAIALSGELEALERKKRRQTEIFIGGLDKDTKEEDITKVFEDSDKIVEVRLLIKGKTGKNKGFGFVRFASAADAKRALEKHPQVEVNFFEL